MHCTQQTTQRCFSHFPQWIINRQPVLHPSGSSQPNCRKTLLIFFRAFLISLTVHFARPTSSNRLPLTLRRSSQRKRRHTNFCPFHDQNRIEHYLRADENFGRAHFTILGSFTKSAVQWKCHSRCCDDGYRLVAAQSEPKNKWKSKSKTSRLKLLSKFKNKT